MCKYTKNSYNSKRLISLSAYQTFEILWSFSVFGNEITIHYFVFLSVLTKDLQVLPC